MATSVTGTENLDLDVFEVDVVRDCVLQEMRELARAMAKALECEPIERCEGNTRWKVERLVKLGFIDERLDGIGGFAGTLLAEGSAR